MKITHMGEKDLGWGSKSLIIAQILLILIVTVM